ncbi:unnamed protein product [Closterium sp. NIES-54]
MPFKSSASADGPVCCLCGGNRHGEPPPDVVRRITYHDRSSRPRESSSAAGASRIPISGKARSGGDRGRAEGRGDQEDGGGSGGKGAAKGAGRDHAAEGEMREMRWPPMRPDPHFADVRAWLGPLLGPVAERSGAAGAWVHRECAIWSPEVRRC